MIHKKVSATILALIVVATVASMSFAQSYEFTYQGKITDTTPASSYDLIFRLCSTETADCSTPLATDSATGVTLSPGGVFTVNLDFGFQHYQTNSARFIEISVRRAGGTAYTTLSPRTKLTAAPTAIYSQRSDYAYTLEGLGASDFIQDNDPRIQPGYNVLNGTTLQTGGNFNIGGTGSAGIVNAHTQFDLGGERILSNGGNHNLFLGLNAGAVNTGSNNAFFGKDTGRLNSIGGNNSFFGIFSGDSNTTGSSNSFFGADSGGNTVSGGSNSFFGSGAGYANQSGNLNAYFGIGSGFNSLGSSNTFLGSGTGNTNTTGSNNTLVGASANVVVNNLTFATAVGAGASVGQSNSVVLGRFSDTVRVPGAFDLDGDSNVDGNGRVGGNLTAASGTARVGIGISTPSYKLHVVDSSNTGLRVQTNTAGGTVASFGANGAFQVDGANGTGGRINLLSNGNLGIGNASPTFMLDVTGSANQGLRVRNTTAGGTLASFGGTGDVRVDSGTTTGGRLSILENGNVGIGDPTPDAKLSITGTGPTSTALEVNNGAIKVTGAGVGTSTPAFIYERNALNSCNGSVFTIIDHPYTNNDPNAILVVTPTSNTYNPNATVRMILFYATSEIGGCGTFFTNRWVIQMDGFSTAVTYRFNVLVIKR